MTTPGAVPEVDPEEGKRRVDAGAMLLDVRTEDEWEAGRAPGSTWIPMREIQARQDEIPTDRPVVVICRTGARSGRVTEALTAAGYDAVNLAGGLVAWDAADLGVVADDGTPGTVA
jgi:rhodanese-related sulfurtransferase